MIAMIALNEMENPPLRRILSSLDRTMIHMPKLLQTSLLDKWRGVNRNMTETNGVSIDLQAAANF